jgi:YggT family protein
VAPGLISGIFGLIFVLIRLYTWAVILAAVFSMLAAFGVLDTRNRLVWSIGDFLYRITEPALRPIRNILPNLGGIDISPLILLLLLQFILVPVVAALERGILFGSWDLLMS